MNKLVKYDPDERILARQAVKDTYFREVRDAYKERLAAAEAAAGAQQATASGGGQSSARGSLENKAGKSASSSTTSIAAASNEQAPEVTGNFAATGTGASRSVSPQELRKSGGLPNIRKGDPMGSTVRQSVGGQPNQTSDTDDNYAADDSTVLPPIVGIKGKRDNKAKPRAFKAAASATLQKTVQGSGQFQSSAHSLGVHGSSKGFQGLSREPAPSMASTGAMSSTYGQGWGGANSGAASSSKDTSGGGPFGAGRGVMSSNSIGGEQPVGVPSDKMNATWQAPSEQTNRKYVSPFAHKTLRDPAAQQSVKKR
eukprot:gnl/TRDRNA2_/TRDRNA2_161804_c0_seq1.p1 gnl/TRDRNA2_/TRDRNA2_161804_c0~~gnl/TRDRNA2_/TRDRNA2_161804_c0_seq1.p1  ORF type:complete len:349 (-),score=77.63 gnl/TRDRNA2_/TRDRNA2_161804_c0_seq1:375-1310(-)